MVFQGQPFEEEKFEEAIGDLREPIKAPLSNLSMASLRILLQPYFI
jgi:hypothetical protein